MFCFLSPAIYGVECSLTVTKMFLRVCSRYVCKCKRKNLQRFRWSEKNTTRFARLQNELLVDEQTEIRRDLLKFSFFTEQEVDAFMAALVTDVTEFGHAMAVEQARQTTLMEERLAQRRKQLAEQKTQDQEVFEVAQDRIKVREQQLGLLVKEGRLDSKASNEILEKYAEDQKRWKEAQDQG